MGIRNASAEPSGRTSADFFAAQLIDAALLAATCATLAYWAVLTLRLPALAWYPFAIVPLAYFAFRWRHLIAFPSMKWDAIVLVLLGLAAVSINVFTSVSNADDFNFLHRAVVAAANLDQPFDITNTGFDDTSLPAISPLHAMVSFEPSIVLLSKMLGLPPVYFTHYVAGSICAFLVPMAFFLCVRLFGFGTLPSLVGSAGVLLFLVLSGDTFRDWGPFTLTRIWQGKCVLVALSVPLTLLFTLKWMEHGSRPDGVRLAFTLVSGMGLSGSALFMLPWVVASAACGYLVVARFNLESAKRAVLAMLLSVVCISCVITASLTFARPPEVTTVWQDGWPRTSLESLGLIILPEHWFISALVLVTGFLVTPRLRLAAALATGTAGSLSLLLVPFTAEILTSLVTPGAFWRFFFTTPLPLAFGFVCAGAAERAFGPASGTSRIVSAILTILVIAFAHTKSPSLSSDLFAWPADPKFVRDDLLAARKLSSEIPEGATVLAPQHIVVVLGLLRPDLRFISTRTTETLHVFANAGRVEEGLRRVAMHDALTNCDALAALAADFQRSSVDVVVLNRDCADTYVALASTNHNASLPRLFDLNGEPQN